MVADANETKSAIASAALEFMSTSRMWLFINQYVFKAAYEFDRRRKQNVRLEPWLEWTTCRRNGK
jgi:hypothetical protein